LGFVLLAVCGLAATRSGLAGLTQAMLGACGLMASVLFHELGHAWMGRRLGLDTVEITLSPIGGAVRMDAVETTPRVDVLIAMAGPLASLWLGLLFSLVYLATPSPTVWFWMALNFGLGIGNLIPALPLDGGRILRGVLAAYYGAFRGTQIATAIAVVITAAMAFTGWWFGQIYVLVVCLPMALVLRRDWLATVHHFSR
jgi:Zn-dependent protease